MKNIFTIGTSTTVGTTTYSAGWSWDTLLNTFQNHPWIPVVIILALIVIVGGCWYTPGPKTPVKRKTTRRKT